MKHEDYCTLFKNEEDQDILTRRLFDVNMRLFKVNSQYRQLVLQAAHYIRFCAQTEKDGYKKPHGYSGANAGIPFNIIALADGTVMLNPRITNRQGERLSISNCGSLMLDTPIRIRRAAYCEVDYFDTEGNSSAMGGYLPTVQHEVEHNLGILITDLEIK